MDEKRGRVVMATGVFDILHPGHLHYLQEAKALGDWLVVVVATDRTVIKRKNHTPITPQDMRLEMISALKPVDEAYIGSDTDPYEIVERIRPDVIALGYDQKHDEDKLRSDLKERGMEPEIVRVGKFDHDLDGTRKIIAKVIEAYIFQQKIERMEGRK